MQQHIDESRGTPESVEKAIANVDLEALNSMIEHGFDPS
jgi:hypothetical protein